MKLKHILSIILIIMPILFGTFLYATDTKINSINRQIENLSENIDQGRINILLNSNQMSKITSSHGDYLILSNLNSSDVQFMEGILKLEILNLYNAMSYGEINLKELEQYSVSELNNMYDSIAQSQMDYINTFVKSKKQKEEELSNYLRSRNIIYSLIIFIQILAAVLLFYLQNELEAEAKKGKIKLRKR